jgi:eukaryotic-like serine/threonine-protein kinase
MILSAGERLGSYEILAPLGAGGMGEVYKARDTRLGRDVALKILPDSFRQDPDRIARFRREAQVLAALNHPRIAAIYGVDEAGRRQFLVLELVDGESLADRIAKGPLPVDEALAVARQIAEALEAAHQKGSVHRDLKPANVALTGDGSVKVLDFGLAKAAEPGSGPDPAAESPTITSPAMLTGIGLILGTAAYMSPEQAKGRPADKRSDIWAFGCVLYEMLTRRRAFEGEDVSDTLANVLKSEPAWTAMPDAVPPHIRLLVQRCLEKDRTRRLSDAGIARFLIDEGGALAAPAGAPAAVVVRQRRWTGALPAVVAALAAAIVTAGVVWTLLRPAPGAVVRFPIVLPDGQQFTGRSQVVTVSSDGSRVVYAATGGQLYLRVLAEKEAHAIDGTALDVMSPVFSPDGEWLAFYSFQDSTLKKIPITGGVPVTLCRADPPFGVTWDGDWIVFADQGAKGVLRVSQSGGEPEVLSAAKPGEVLASPQMLDGGRTILFTVAPVEGGDRWDRAQVVAQAIGSTERRVVWSGGSEARVLPSGHLMYMVGTTLLAMPLDLRTLRPRGAAVPLIEGVRRFSPNFGSPAASFAFSPSGLLLYISGSTAAGATQRTISLVTSDGTVRSLNIPPQPYFYPRLSPTDANRLVFETDDATETIIWVYDLNQAGPPRRLTFGGRNAFPIWTSDGRQITFQSDRNGVREIFWQPADGTRSAERLWKSNDPKVQPIPEAWSPDGKRLLFSVIPPFDSRIMAFSIDGQQTQPALSPDLPARHSSLSPDGKWIAYSSTEVGNRAEIFVQPYPPTGAKYQISTEGGRMPLWARNGQRLYYWANFKQQLAAVDIQTQLPFTIGNRTVLPISGVYAPGFLGVRNYDVTPDGKQFVVVTFPETRSREGTRPAAARIEGVLNWFEELKARVPPK